MDNVTTPKATDPTLADGAHLDVRELSPRQRHPLIFETWQALAPGQSFTLINDHDPKPLYYHFAAEHSGRFDWQYLEEGPEVWRVRIGKIAVAPCARQKRCPTRWRRRARAASGCSTCARSSARAATRFT